MQTQRQPKIGHFYTYDHSDYSNIALCYYYDKREVRFIEYDTGSDTTLYFNKMDLDRFNRPGFVNENPYNKDEYWFECFFEGMELLLNGNRYNSMFTIDERDISFVKEAWSIFKTINHIGIDYENYLQTIQWKRIRNRKLDEYPYCQVCGATEHLEVHHCTYAHVGNEEGHMKDLTVLCHNCHTLFHLKR